MSRAYNLDGRGATNRQLLIYGTAVLDREAWIACEIIKIGWRAANSNIARMWKDLERAVREAVYSPGTITEAGRVQYKVAHGFLFARLPSGRCDHRYRAGGRSADFVRP